MDELKQKIDDLIALYEEREDEPTEDELSMIQDLYRQLEISKEKQKELQSKTMVEKLEVIAEATQQSKELPRDITKEITDALSKLVLPTPVVNVAAPPAPVVNVPAPKVEVNVPKQPPFPKIPAPIVNIPDTVTINKPSWLGGIINLKPVLDKLTEIKNSLIFPTTVFPTDPENPLAVRLSDGEKFYKAVGGMVSAIGSSFPFQDSNKNNKPVLVNNDGSINVDATVDTSLLATSANQTNGTQASKFVDESGTPYGVKHINNKPRVSSMPYLYDIAEGNVANHTPYAKLGYNGDVGSTEEDIITQGGTYYWIPTATALEVVSSSANDDLTGTGVQKVKITYLDADYSQQSQTIDMDGTTPVALTDTTILRVNSIRATQVGTGMMAAGDIIVRTVAGTNTVRQIAAGFTRGRGLTYNVPLGKTLYLTSISVFSGYTTAGKVVRWIGRAKVDDTAPTVKIDFFQPFFEAITQDASFHADFDMPISIPATADLKVSAISNGAGSFCSCALRGWLE